MTEALTLLVVWLAGGGIGIMFFGGLWWTIRLGVSSRYAGLWFAGSLLLRVGLALAGFYLICGAHWGRMLVCLTGFVVARFAVTWATHSSSDHHPHPRPAAPHAV
jgi:F1F0 ATPase subunit 2